MQNDLFAPPKPAKRGQRPSEQLAEVLTGNIMWEQASTAIRSWAQFYIYDAACQIVKMDTRDKRAMALGKVPISIRPLIEAEVQRLWPIRNQLA